MDQDQPTTETKRDWREGYEPKTLSMEDPCPHVSRLDIIAAKLRGDSEEIQDLLDHIDTCSPRAS